ncbi:MAG: UbiA family prenyltransferase [archaeon]|jgi:geranylgeranylglycerol-phosphate geranylgeranyltransferase
MAGTILVKKKVFKKRVVKEKKLPLKERVIAYVELMRIGNCIMAAIAVIIGFFLAQGLDYRAAGIAAFSTFLICGAGQAINDYFDASVDEKSAKPRPIPSGRIAKQKALYFSIFLFFLGVAASFFINPATMIVAIAFSILLISYPLFMNKIKYIGNGVVAMGTAITFVYGASAAGSVPALVLFISLTAFLSNMGREITKDIEDIRKDKDSKKTLPMLIGTSASKGFVLVYYALAAIGSVVTFVLFNLNNYYLAFVLISIALFAYSLFLLYSNSPMKSQKASKTGMLASLVAFVFAGFK